MTVTLQNWGILRGLKSLADADKEFDYHGISIGMGDGDLEVFDALTDLRVKVRRAVWEGECDLLPSDAETCRVIKGALQVLLEAGCLADRTGPNARLCAALLDASAALHLVTNDDDGGGGSSPADEPPPDVEKAEPLDTVLAEIIAGA